MGSREGMPLAILGSGPLAREFAMWAFDSGIQKIVFVNDLPEAEEGEWVDSRHIKVLRDFREPHEFIVGIGNPDIKCHMVSKAILAGWKPAQTIVHPTAIVRSPLGVGGLVAPNCVVTCDINDFTVDTKFDRVVSVEMFEHVRNHGALMQNINEWLHAEGKLFVHIFCHNRFTYPFEDAGATSWMARHFFSGGIMPGRDLLLHYQRHLKLETSWNWDGRHYERTSNEWLLKMDQNPAEVRTVLQQAYGKDWQMWRQRWRMFFMACAELFGFNGGSEWFVAHYLFSKPTVNGSQISRPG